MPPATVSRWLKDFAVVIVCIFGGIYLLMVLGTIGSGTFSTKNAPKNTDISSVAPGSEGHLTIGGSVIPVAIDQESIPELKRAVGRNDLSGVAPIFVVSDDTLVRVSEAGPGGLRITILTGSQKRPCRLGTVGMGETEVRQA